LVFFQAEDGIRDFHVTGVQTCALPISAPAVAAPGTLWTSGYVTVASSRVRVTDQPGVNRHSAITQRPSSMTYASEYSPVESVSEIGTASCRERVQTWGARATSERRRVG